MCVGVYLCRCRFTYITNDHLSTSSRENCICVLVYKYIHICVKVYVYKHMYIYIYIYIMNTSRRQSRFLVADEVERVKIVYMYQYTSKCMSVGRNTYVYMCGMHIHYNVYGMHVHKNKETPLGVRPDSRSPTKSNE